MRLAPPELSVRRPANLSLHAHAAFAATFDEVDLAMRQGNDDACARFDASFSAGALTFRGCS